MALESQKHPYELMLRFSPHPNRGALGSVLTYQFIEGIAVFEDGEFQNFTPGNPVDLTQEQAAKYLGEQMAGFLDGLTTERAAAESEKATLQAKIDEHLATIKERDQTIADRDALIAKLDTLLDGTEAGRAELARREKEAVANAATAALEKFKAVGGDVSALAAVVVGG